MHFSQYDLEVYLISQSIPIKLHLHRHGDAFYSCFSGLFMLSWGDSIIGKDSHHVTSETHRS